MKSARTIWLVAVVLFLCACPALGVIEFKDGLTHNIDYEIEETLVLVDYETPGMQTKVNLLNGGRIISLYGWEDSCINILDGMISWNLNPRDRSQVAISGGLIGDLWPFDNSQVDISGGTVDHGLYAFDSSQVSISGGSIEEDLRAFNSSQISISGGLIGEVCAAWDNSQISISGGTIGEQLLVGNSSQVNIFGGSIDGYLSNRDSSKVNISGGLISGNLLLSNQSKIRIFGSDFAVDGQPFGFGELTSILGGNYWDEPIRRLTGTLLSGELINNGFRIGHDARIVLIPEPASAMILGLGGIFFAIRRKQR